jgi:hypothetical protein
MAGKTPSEFETNLSAFTDAVMYRATNCLRGLAKIFHYYRKHEIDSVAAAFTGLSTE